VTRQTSGNAEEGNLPRTVDAEFAATALAPPSGCPIGWQPSALAPVFYGHGHYTPGDGAPANLRVFYPSLDGAPEDAPILSGCGRYPVILFAHGFCAGDTDHYLRWFHLPSQLARSGYVVVVPQLADIATHPTASPATQQTLTSTLAWIRQSWEHRLTLLPAPATGLAGHSHGALHAGILATSVSVAAVASISGTWLDWPAGGGTKPIFQGAPPRLFTWGSNTVSDVHAALSSTDWSAIAKPKHRAIFGDAEHFDYLYTAQLPCFSSFPRGDCPHVGSATADLVTMFFANYLAPELWPDLPSRVPNNLVPPPLSLTPEQQFYAGGHLVGMPAFNGDSRCQVSITFALPLNKTVPNVREMLRTQAAQAVQNAGLVPKFSGSTSTSAWVSSQSPTAGTMVAADSEVRMTMQTGPIP
jgi:Chlorophyllase enzyme/PASTA domain